MTSDTTLLHLSLIDGIGPATVQNILERKPNNFDLNTLYLLSSSELQNIFKLTSHQVDLIFKGLADKNLLNDEIELIDKYKINWMSFVNPNYPYLLKNIHWPPITLYWTGKALDDADKKIAIIGSRKANNYGKKVIQSIVKPLVSNNWYIVSGGAIGADTMAHEAALECSGRTIVVLGSGLLNPHPSSNKKLFERIINNGGTILSSYPLKTIAWPANFPARNRIISGISQGCVVVQASVKSGTRITALNALEQGREVFAIPGLFDDELSAGCHKLIQEGAKLVCNANDILQEFGENLQSKEPENIEEPEVNLNIAPLSLESKILNLCKEDPCSIDELANQSETSINELQFTLFQMQIEGKIKQNFAGLWESI